MTPKRIGLVIILFLASMIATAALVITKFPNSFLLYVVLVIVMITVIVKLVQPTWVKWTVGVFSLVAFWEMGHIDEFLGEREHRGLCEKYAGVKVYGTVRLPTEFYDVNGVPKFLDSKFNPNEKLLQPYVRFVSQKENASTRYVTIDQFRYQILDASTGKVLGEIINYNRATSPFILTIAQAGGHQGWCDSYGSNAWFNRYHELFQRVLIK